jgi:hypothetical protein
VRRAKEVAAVAVETRQEVEDNIGVQASKGPLVRRGLVACLGLSNIILFNMLTEKMHNILVVIRRN